MNKKNWTDFTLALGSAARVRLRDKIKDIEINDNIVRITGYYAVKFPPEMEEGRRNVTLVVEFLPEEDRINCFCDPLQVWSRKTLLFRTEGKDNRLFDGERPLNHAQAAEELFNEFTDHLEPGRAE